jgi:hypothetical protein
MIQRITLLLDVSEMAALRQAARKDLRKPRDHARFLLRLALDEPPAPAHLDTKENGSGRNFTTASPAAARQA